MLFPVLIWSLSTILKVSGRNIPLDFSAKERKVNTILNDVEQKKSNQWSKFPSKDLFENKLENLMQLENLFHVKSKNIGSTIAPASYLSTSSPTSTPKHSPSSRASPSPRQRPPSTTTSTTASASKPLPTSSSPRSSPTTSKLSTSPSRKRLQLTTTKQKTTKVMRGAFNFRKREAASPKPSTTSKATTSSTTKRTTTVKPDKKVTLNPKCLILKKMNAKLPPDCTSTSNIMNPWN